MSGWKRPHRSRITAAPVAARLLLTLGVTALLCPALANTDITVKLYSTQIIPSIKVEPAGGLLGWSACRDCPWTPVSGAVAFVLQTRSRGILVNGKPAVEAHLRGSWRITPQGRSSAAGDFPLRIRSAGGSLAVIASIPLDDYVRFALRGESGGFRSLEAQKAMAVAARTFALGQRGKRHKQDFDYCDTTHCQDIQLRGSNRLVDQAVVATAGEMLWYQGQLTVPFYHAHCGGTLEAARNLWPHDGKPYLKVQEDPYCRSAGRLPWKVAIPIADLARALHSELARDKTTAPAPATVLRVQHRSPSGRVQRVALSGDAGSLTVSAENLRLAIGRTLGWGKIRSDYYDISPAGSAVVFAGFGAGHGVGLCQTGAEEMARRGMSYRDILSFYFPGAAVGANAQGHEWVSLGGERVQVLSIEPDRDRQLPALVERLLREAEQATGFTIRTAPQIRVYPTVDAFRDATGEPGWVAAATRGGRIHLQPAGVLRANRVLESTLRHELLHVLIEERAHPSLPLWYREGLTQRLARPAQSAAAPRAAPWDAARIEQALRQPASLASIRQAYSQAAHAVARLEREYSRAVLLTWIHHGLPAGISSSGGHLKPGE